MTAKLSPATASRIDWTAIKDSSIGTSVRGLPASEAAALPEVKPSDLERVFTTMRSEFTRALSGLRRLMTIFLLSTGVSLAAAIAGVVIIYTIRDLTAGVTLSTTGVIALLDLFRRVTRIGREQAMLELIPAKYELALKIAATAEDRRKVLQSLLKEMDSLHK